MQDTALDDFMNRFGQIEKPKQFKPGQQNITMNKDAVSSGSKPALLMGVSDTVTSESVDAKRFKIGDTGVADSMAGNAPVPEGDPDKATTGADVSGAIAGGIGLFETFSGSGMSTDAEGPGPGKASGQIMKGAAAGAQAGAIAGPWGAAIGAAAGAGGGAMAHNKARMEYVENQTTDNLNKSALEQKQNMGDYRMAKGLASIKDSKALLEKQMNIIS